jgi:thiol-disulfide isomerase/thioredoxin
MSSQVIHVSDTNTFNMILEDSARKNTWVVVKAGASWCRPCTQIKPKFDQWSSDQKYSSIKFLDVDIEDMDDSFRKYQVNALPTFLFILNKEVLCRVVGISTDTIQNALDACVGSAQ